MLSALDAASGELTVVTSATKRSTDFITLLEVLNRRCAPCPAGAINKPTAIILDNGPIHTSRLSRKALAARPWLTVEWLPKYATELNDTERNWRDLKRHNLANRTLPSLDHLDHQIHRVLQDMNNERAKTACSSLV